ncbi:MAG: hypothetical protein IID42_06090, partial [Planctomycetes bacterium]|nr:hypothetical protein [Planctomycetota bacterium]
VRPPSSSSVDSKVWNKVAGDPLVERVRSAVDGTLFDIRTSEDPEDADGLSSEQENLAGRE